MIQYREYQNILEQILEVFLTISIFEKKYRENLIDSRIVCIYISHSVCQIGFCNIKRINFKLREKGKLFKLTVSVYYL